MSNSKNELIAPVYFSMADLQLESLLDVYAFEKSLILNILFQPSILIPDIFFFISSGISDHLKQGRQTLLEAGLQSGLIVPAFRNPHAKDFRSILYKMKGDGDPSKAILGIRNDAEETAKRLDLAIQKTPDFIPWPEWNVGKKFQDIVEKNLKSATPPSIDSETGIRKETIQSIWDYTKKWRYDCVDAAIEKTKVIAGEGLRRGALITEVGRTLGLVKGNETLNDISYFFTSDVSPEDQYHLYYFCRWMTDCYQFNQAKAFKCAPNFPEFDSLSGLIATQILNSGNKPSGQEASLDSVTLEIEIPPINLLRTISPKNLIAIQSELGAAYRKAISDWQEDNTSSTEQALEDSLRNYASEIVRWARKQEQVPTNILEATVVRLKNVDPVLGVALGGVVTAAVASVSPELALSLTAANTGYALYRWRHRGTENVTINIDGRKTRKIHRKGIDLSLTSPAQDIEKIAPNQALQRTGRSAAALTRKP